MQILRAEEPLPKEHEKVAESVVYRLEVVEWIRPIILELIEVYSRVDYQEVSDQKEERYYYEHAWAFSSHDDRDQHSQVKDNQDRPLCQQLDADDDALVDISFLPDVKCLCHVVNSYVRL